MGNYDDIVIGAGASGLLAAISASSRGARVLIIERNARPARKMMISGKGRCNVTNSADIKEFMQNIYPEPRFLYSAFNTFFSNNILQILDECGVPTVLERGGRYFPESGKAVSVVDALYNKAKSVGVNFLFSQRVAEIICENNIIIGVALESEKIIKASKVIVCTGGKSYPKTGSDGDGYRFAQKCGHSVSELFPALVPLIGNSKCFPKLQDLTLRNINLSLYINGKKTREEFGEMTFTDNGLGGPVVIALSRWAVRALAEGQKVKMSIDLKPALDDKKLDERILRDLNANGKMPLRNLFKSWMPIALISYFEENLNIDLNKLANQVSGVERKSIVYLMKNMDFDIVDHRDFDEAIITSGGVCLKEINPKTMESKLVKGLFFAGEILDIDANTGGFNFQIAFSTGWLAGMQPAIK